MATRENPQSSGSATPGGAAVPPDEPDTDEPDVKEPEAKAEKYDGDPVAVYLGRITSTRIVSAADFARLGAKGQKEDVVFNKENNHTVLLEGMSKAAVEILGRSKDIELRGV